MLQPTSVMRERGKCIFPFKARLYTLSSPLLGALWVRYNGVIILLESGSSLESRAHHGALLEFRKKEPCGLGETYYSLLETPNYSPLFPNN